MGFNEFDTYDDSPLSKVICPSCDGIGQYSVGDSEDGVEADCPECEGSGFVESGEALVYDRDAWKVEE